MTTSSKIAHNSGRRPATQKGQRPKPGPHVDRYQPDEMAALIRLLAARINGTRS